MSTEPGLYERLTPSEKAVFHALVAGHSATEYARLTSKSAKTIQTQKAAVFAKLQVCSGAELIAYARRLGLDEARL